MAVRGRLVTRKVLVASVGLASVSYVLSTGCDKRAVDTESPSGIDGGRFVSGNLMPPRPRDAAPDPELLKVLADGARDAGDADAAAINAVLNRPGLDASIRMITSGNLMAPTTDEPLLKKAADAGAAKKTR